VTQIFLLFFPNNVFFVYWNSDLEGFVFECDLDQACHICWCLEAVVGSGI